jgi:hypothetical protein
LTKFIFQPQQELEAENVRAKLVAVDERLPGAGKIDQSPESLFPKALAPTDDRLGTDFHPFRQGLSGKAGEDDFGPQDESGLLRPAS